MFSLICVLINGWVNNGEAGDLICHRAHYDVNVMRPSADDVFRCIVPNQNSRAFIAISRKFVLSGPIDNKSTLTQMMAWCQTVDKPLPETMLQRSKTLDGFIKTQWLDTLRSILSSAKSNSNFLQVSFLHNETAQVVEILPQWRTSTHWPFHFHNWDTCAWKDVFYIEPGARHNIKMSSYQYRDPHVKDKTVSRPSYLYYENPYMWERRSLYWDPGLCFFGKLTTQSLSVAITAKDAFFSRMPRSLNLVRLTSTLSRASWKWTSFIWLCTLVVQFWHTDC